MTSWLYEQRRLGIRCPEIMEYKLDDILQRRPLEIPERTMRILRQIQSKTTVVGTEVLFNMAGGVIYRLDLNSTLDVLTSEYCKMLACSECIDGDEFLYLLEFLVQAGLIERTRVNNPTQGCILTVTGFARLSELDGARGDSARAFVAMWFDNSTSEAWVQGLRPAIRAAGYEPIRMDEQHHANKICDEIVAEIKRSRFVVADFTQGKDGARGGVYYEAGLAHGLGIQVIFTCHTDCMDKLHFDTRQYNHIEWNETADLREQLTARISAVVGDGPNKTE